MTNNTVLIRGCGRDVIRTLTGTYRSIVACRATAGNTRMIKNRAGKIGERCQTCGMTNNAILVIGRGRDMIKVFTRRDDIVVTGLTTVHHTRMIIETRRKCATTRWGMTGLAIFRSERHVIG